MPKQFNHVTRFNATGIGKLDIDGLVGVVRRVQASEMKTAKGIQDITFTVWVFVPAKGVNLRVRYESVNAERAQKELEVGTSMKISGNIVAADFSKGGPWVRGTSFEVLSAGKETGIQELK